jgi:hypothetical protein
MTDPDFSQATWCKSRRSSEQGGNCVELARVSDTIGVRDSKHPLSDHLTITTRAFSRLITDLKS